MHIIYNRGIGGYETSDLLASMEACIFELEPSKLIINIGTNDIGSALYTKETLIANYDEILTQIHERLSECAVYVMACYPANAKEDFPGVDQSRKKELFKTRTNQTIREANEAVKELSKKHGYEFINVNHGLTNDEGNLKAEYTIDGVHFWPNAYSVILQNMREYL